MCWLLCMIDLHNLLYCIMLIETLRWHTRLQSQQGRYSLLRRLMMVPWEGKSQATGKYAHAHILYHSGWSDFASFELKCPTLPGGTCPKLWKKMLMMTLQNMMVCIWVLLILFIFICSCICIFIVGYDYYSLIWIIDNSTFNWLNYLSCIAGIVLLLFWN